MTNKGFYGDKLLALALEENCKKLYRITHGKYCVDHYCEDCEFDGAEKILQWLNAEHEEPEPPLLENGEGLKPGDKIMVRDNNGQKWAQATYLFYFNKMFYCVDGVRYIAEEGNFVNWKQARLPEEGE